MSTLPDIVNEECVSRHNRALGSASCSISPSTHSSFTISSRVRVSGYSNWFSVGGESPLGYVHSIVYPKAFLTNLESVLFRQGQ